MGFTIVDGGNNPDLNLAMRPESLPIEATVPAVLQVV
jgi:hypothetical protein